MQLSFYTKDQNKFLNGPKILMTKWDSFGQLKEINQYSTFKLRHNQIGWRHAKIGNEVTLAVLTIVWKWNQTGIFTHFQVGATAMQVLFEPQIGRLLCAK